MLFRSDGSRSVPSVLICRYVGFPLIFNKCPYLTSQVSITVAKHGELKNRDNASGIKVPVPTPEPPRSYKEWALQRKQKIESDIISGIEGGGSRNPVRTDISHTARAPVPVVAGAAMSLSNPLVTVSKHWCASSRRAMLTEWRRGACVEWRVVSELMASERITKVTLLYFV